MSKPIFRIAIPVFALAALLSGCDKPGKAPADTQQAASGKTPSANNATAATEEKFNAYTKAFNELIDENWGVQENFRAYTKEDIPNAKPSDNVFFSESIPSLERAVAALKDGRSVDGDASGAADAAVDKLLPAAEKLLAQWKELKPYFTSKAYREDGLAKAKAAHADVVASYEATLSGVGALDAALTAYQRDRSARQLEAFKSDGNLIAYNTVNTMQLADHFVSAATAQKMTEADGLLVELEASLAALGKTYDGMAVSDDNRVEIGSIRDRLGRMVGNYRDYKQDEDADDMNRMIDQYNNAIEEYNDVEWDES